MYDRDRCIRTASDFIKLKLVFCCQKYGVLQIFVFFVILYLLMYLKGMVADMQDSKSQSRIFYGWVVAVACSLLAFSVNAMGNNSLSFYVTPLAEAFGVSRALLNFCLFTVSAIVRTVCGFFYGSISKKFGVKPLMIAGILLAVAAYIVFSQAKGVLMIAVGSGMYGIAHSIGTFSAYNAIVNNWFVEKKGFVLGLVNTSVGLGGMVINPLAGNWIASVGWNYSFLFTAAIIGAIAIPAVCFIKITPEEKGLAALGSENRPKAEPEFKGEKLTLTGAMKTSRFWMIVAVQFITGFAVGQAFANIIPHLNALNIDKTLVSNVLSIVLALGVSIGCLATGFVFDKFGLRMLFFSIAAVQLTGIVIACFAGVNIPPALLIICVFCVGYGNSITLGTLAHMINYAFGYGKTNFGAIFAWLFAVGNAGTILGSPFAGWLFDIYGTYRMSYIIAGAALILVLVLVNVIINMGKKENA